MGIFGANSAFDQLIEKATSEANTTDDWALIMEICDRVVTESNGSKECMRAIVKRLNNSVPTVVMQSLTLLDACVSNCGKPFHLEVCSRDFESEIRKLLSKSHPKVSEKLRLLIKKWAQQEFKNDPQLSLIPALYNKLKSEGMDFNSSEPQKKVTSLPKNPDVVTSNQEEEDIAKAIELSLKESSSGSPNTISKTVSNDKTTSLYPSFNSESITTSNSAKKIAEKESFKVRALYDFEAAEDNELTFKSGEIILVSDDSDTNWWKGSNHRGEGLFPSNFVTNDLEAEPEPIYKSSEKKVQFSEEIKVKVVEKEPEIVEIDEEKIDRLLHLIHEADPNGEKSDSEDLLILEEQCTAMTPLIDQELEHVDRKHASLTAVNLQLNSALNLYHSLMKESFAMINSPYYGTQNINTFSGVHPFGTNPQQNNEQMYNNMSNVSNPVISQQMGPQSTSYQIPYSIQGSIVGPNNMTQNRGHPQYVNSMIGQNTGHPQTIPQQSYVQPIPTAAIGVSQIERYVDGGAHQPFVSQMNPSSVPHSAYMQIQPNNYMINANINQTHNTQNPSQVPLHMQYGVTQSSIQSPKAQIL